VRGEAASEDRERIAIREALAFGKAVCDRRVALDLSVADLAVRAGMTTDEIQCIEEGGTEPTTLALLRRLAAALDADVRLTPGQEGRPSASADWPAATSRSKRPASTSSALTMIR